jgi:hypothetical protein
MEKSTSTLSNLVKAIRSDRRVGRGSCTSIDECYEDCEIAEELSRENVTTIEGAIKWAINREALWQGVAKERRDT